MRTRLTLFCLLLLNGSVWSDELATAADSVLRFNRDIRPILTDKCFACHGPDAQTVEGGLRLDIREEATSESAGAIVPGSPDESEVVRRILSTDADEVMPPAESHKAMTKDERDIIVRWISQGAAYEAHWAYEPMHDIDARHDSAARMIDGVIATRLTQENATPTKQADRVTLIRRLCLDLNGIPPTAKEVDAFVRDESDQAYTNLVDRLLNSPRFGERMAVYWLDLVRYADTVGYHGDQDVSQSPYRDYVINAFNANMPYDQFVREQLAGDLLPDATTDQQVASGYNRLNQTTEEGGAQAKEYLSIYFADRVRNVSQVFMGATMGCAQCHDHKYDPYTTRDFYSMGAFFADLDERGVYGARKRPPMIYVPGEDLLNQLASFDREISELENELETTKQQLISKQVDWEAMVSETIGEHSETVDLWIDDELKIEAELGGDWGFGGGEGVPVHEGKLSRRQQSSGIVQHRFTSSKKPLAISEGTKYFCWVYLDPENPPSSVMLQFNNGNWEHRKLWGGDQISFGRQKESHDGYRRAGALPETGKWVRLEVTAEEVGLSAGDQLQAMAFTQFGGLAFWDDCGTTRYEGPSTEIVQAIQTPVEDRTESQRSNVQQYYLDQCEELVAVREQHAAHQAKRKAALETAPLTVVSRSVKPRQVRVLPRGNWMDDSGDVVGPAIPAFLGEIESGDRRPTRLDLANWLCRDDNPLTARTMVNRIWGLLFGRGICASVDDFGGQGSYPSYPDLLDALAIEFVESGWDMKHIVRAIVSSDTYRRSSVPTADLVKRDPYNELFARQGRFTVEAEVVRDAALAISGLLVEKVGGRSVRPYQPSGYYAQLNFPRRSYKSDSGSDQYRRGLYTHWQRTFLHPMLKAFDAPSREECTASRSRSNTPLQALVLLNDPTFVEAARVFAERVMTEGGDDTAQRIDWAYRTAVSRSPESRIQDELQRLYEDHLAYYRSNVADAEKLISHGEAKVAKELDVAELAAWTSVSRAILNLHETITRS